ncbi:MAG TPA: hypothetical protein VGA00_13625 [Acidiferrobacterales bacterium]
MSATGIHVYLPPGGAPSPTQLDGKFLQISWRGRDHLLFAPKSLHRYHNQMLAQFLAEHGIAHHWASDQQLDVDDPELRIHGGGRFRADAIRRELTLWDNSQAYGRFDAERAVGQIAAADHAWSAYRVVVD